MKIQVKKRPKKYKYPEEFTGFYGKKYKLIKVYEHYGLYISDTGFRTCFNIDSIRRETTMKRDI